ncbi:PLP-dependent aminotransferase family protein [Oxalobacteraceae bacterium A2-2]
MPRGRIRHRPAVTIDREALAQQADGAERKSLVDRIVERVVKDIQSGKLSAGQRVHSVRQLADECGVSRDTVVRAYDKLIVQGRLESRPGSGFFVRADRRASWRADEPGGLHLLSEWRRFQLLRPPGDAVSTTGLGVLPPDWLDETAVGKALRSVARASARSLMAYPDPLGYLPLRQQLQAKLRDLQIDVPAARIMTTAGATDALHLVVLRYLSVAGTPVLVEEPGPLLLRDRLLSTGLEIAAVPRQADGPDLEVLRAQCERHRPRFFFCNSVLHNPTSGNISPHKAFQILRLAEEFDLTIVEDDTYSDLMVSGPGAPATRLASLDQLQRVIYIGSFSKMLSPGLRVGYVCASQKVIDWLVVYRTVSQIAGTSLNERVVYQLLSQGSYRHHAAQLRARLDACRQPVIEQLGAFGCGVAHAPDAGMYVWANLPGGANATTLAARLGEEGHLMAPGELFTSNQAYRSHMRFNISRTLGSPALPALARLLKS